MGKPRKRIKQTKTEFQKIFDAHEGMLQSAPWLEVAPEVLHIALALQDHSFEVVQHDFNTLCEKSVELGYANSQYCFTLSRIVATIQADIKYFEIIKGTVFENGIRDIICLYNEIFSIRLDCRKIDSIMPLAKAYNSILDGRSDVSILCKQLTIHRHRLQLPDPTGFLKITDKEQILLPENVSSIMALFPITVRMSDQVSFEFCEDLWLFNYFRMPFGHPPNDIKSEQAKFREHNISLYRQKLIKAFEQFKQIPILAIFPRGVAEIVKGCCARINNLSVDIIGFVETHKGEVADIVLRSVIETQFNLLWLLAENNPEYYQRFREFSTGKEKFMGYRLAKLADDIDVISQTGNDIAAQAVKESGIRDELVAEERGDAFETNISQMAEKIWGKDNLQYFNYKRLSETTHGHWRVIEKYHLVRSLNPMQQGLLDYKTANTSFNGLTPAFAAIITTLDTLIAVLDLIEHEKAQIMRQSLIKLWESVNQEHLKYIGLDPKMLVPNSGNVERKGGE